MKEPIQFYINQLQDKQTQLLKVKKKLSASSLVRIFIFLAVIAIIYFGYPNTQIIIASIIIGLGIFIFLLNRHTDLEYQRDKLKELIRINQLEITIASGHLTELDAGAEFINPGHEFSHDIDLFGPKSFFQYINRTVTLAGKKNLASVLTANAINAITSKQEAIDELAKKSIWRQEFSAIASLVNVTVAISSIQKWFEEYKFFVPAFIKWVPLLFTSISICLTTLLFFDVITFQGLLYWFFLGLGITGVYLKKINVLYNNANKVQSTFEQYYKLVDLIEKEHFTTNLLTDKKNIVISNKEKASIVLKQFAGILSAFDQRNNMMFGVLANGLFLWDIWQSRRIEDWIKNHNDKVKNWFDVIAFFDTYNTLGNFAFNHPDFVYPEITNNHTTIEATALGHPLLNPKKRVDNDIAIANKQFFIITGANMAGKSTFLRTVALQIVMSNVGLPVCAQSCKYRPIKLITSMRTADSLGDDASYFFSELSQLKNIVEKIEKHEYFIILDEILKGTNSKDKASGSRKFVERLVKASATGIIATHDLSLCEIANDFPEVKNRFFDAQINNDELYFDYKFKKGICQNMNASFLLKKMGIV